VRVAVLLEQLLAPVPGGTGRYSRELARALAATAPPGAVVSGWTAWHRDLAPAAVTGVAGPYRLPLPRRLLAAGWAWGMGPAPTPSPPHRPTGSPGPGPDTGQVVHAPTPLIPPARGAPLVVTLHDAVPWTAPETLTRYGAAWHRAMGRRAIRDADLVVVPTEAAGRDIVRCLGQPRRLAVVGEAVSPDLAEPADAARRRSALGLTAGGYLATVATLEPRKGLDVAIAALAEPAAPQLPLAVVGPAGWGRDAPAALAAGHRLPADRVRLLGRLADPDLAAVLAGAAAVLVPSRAEGFGLPALEAMALGAPVVASDVPALAEVTGGAAVLVPPGDPAALAAAAAGAADHGDPEARAVRIAAGRARAAAFSWPEVARRMWQLYADVLHQRTGGSG
jgi:glycosyltransferase involved in cell wall biosynthesis